MKDKTVVVIGAGPAGLMAAIMASQNPKNRVIVIEKNMEAGNKLLLTGGGRCNLTNSCSVDQIIKNTVNNGKFLFSSLDIFNNKDLIRFFEDHGLKLKEEEGGKIFPITNKAKDVIATLIRVLNENSVDIWYSTEVKDLNIRENSIDTVLLSNGNLIKADRVILTTGGMSYPKTGSTGDGHIIVENLGHSIAPIKPGLVPIEIKEDWVKGLMGISLENTEIICNIKEKNKENKKPKVIKWTGPLIFTHYGISGPAVLNLSSYLNRYMGNCLIEIVIDLIPSVKSEQLENILITKDINKNESIFKILTRMLPKNLIIKLLEVFEINKETKVSDISKEESKKIIATIKSLKITPKGLRHINEAIITSGGISVKEINPKTMESKLVKGLYFAGEVIDIDAITGGYNLQIAFSTGYVAGSNA